MKYMAILDAYEKPVSCDFIGCNGNVTPYLIGSTTDIKALEQEPKTEWIPVSERLPEKDGQYLVLYDFGDGSYDYKVLHYITESDDLWDEGWNKIDDMFNKMVDWSMDMVAWMPLPEPYEPQERSDKE